MNFDFPSFVIGFIGGTVITGIAMVIEFIRMEMDDKNFFRGWTEGEKFGRASERARTNEKGQDHGV